MIASDIHGSAPCCTKMLEAFSREEADRLLLLGDILYHGPRNDLPEGYAPKEVIAMLNPMKKKLLCVRGNCDTEVDQMVLEFPILADYCFLELADGEGKSGPVIFATHGHIYNPHHLPPLSDGDILLKADTTTLDRFGEDCLRSVIEANNVTVLREGKEVVIPIPEDMMQRLLRDKKGFAALRFPMIVKSLPDSLSSAALAGVLPGDSILSINNEMTPTFTDAVIALNKHRSQEIQLGISRAGVHDTLTMQVDSLGKIGVMVVSPTEMYDLVTLKYNFFQSFPAGIEKGVSTLTGYMNDMKYVFTKEGASSLGGFGAIGSLFPATWDWEVFWERTAWLSVILAFMNIIPIPALDGGHVMFLLYEVITRRKPSDKFLEYAQMAGMAFLFALLLYANGNDIIRYFFQ